MNQKDLFNLAVRILGLVFLYTGLQSLPMVAARLWEALFSVFNGPPQFQGMLLLLTMVAWQLVLAVWLISGAPWLMNRAYPAGSPIDPEAAAKDRRPFLRDPAAPSNP